MIVLKICIIKTFINYLYNENNEVVEVASTKFGFRIHSYGLIY